MTDRDRISPVYDPVPHAEYDSDRWVRSAPFSPNLAIESPMTPTFPYGAKQSIAERTEFLPSGSDEELKDDGRSSTHCSQMEGGPDSFTTYTKHTQSHMPLTMNNELQPLAWHDRLLFRFWDWYIRYRTLLLILGFYLLSLALALLHFGFNMWLNGKRPEDTITQRPVTYAGVIFANLSKASLTAGLGVAYIQVVWYKLRRRWTTARLIDRLLSLPWSPADLLYLKSTLFKAPFEWIFALFCVAVPVVLSLPPASLKTDVAQLYEKTFVTDVPNVNLTHRKDLTWDGHEAISLFNMVPGTFVYTTDTIRWYENPEWAKIPNMKGHEITTKPNVQKIATSTLRHAEIEAWKNPFDRPGLDAKNASYTFQFTGPKYRCTYDPDVPFALDTVNYPDKPINTYALEHRPQFEMDGNELYFTARFIERYQKPENLTSVDKNGNVPFFPGLKDVMKSISCRLGLTNYTVDVKYINDKGAVNQTDDGSFAEILPSYGLYHYYMPEFRPDHFDETINETLTERDWYRFRHEQFREEVRDEDLEATITAGRIVEFGNMPFRQRFLEMQARGIARAMFEVLYGRISGFGLSTDQERIFNTLLLQSPAFSRTDPTQTGHLNITITPQILEQTLANISAALPDLSYPWITPANITTTPWAYVYDFNRRWLVFPYASVLIVGAGFLLVGIGALQANGVSSAKGFLQIVATSTASEQLRDVARECCLGGEENFTKKLSKLELKFGDALVVKDRSRDASAGGPYGGAAMGRGGYGEAGRRGRGEWLTSLGTREEVEKMQMVEEKMTVGDAGGFLRWRGGKL